MTEIRKDLTVSATPHLVRPIDTAYINRDVATALIPQLLVSVYIFGIRALIMTAVCVASAVAFEWGTRKILGRESTIGDWSAAVTGMILAFNLTVSLPYWMAVIGAFTAIVIVKQLFGGLGQNFVNPAAAARVALYVSFSKAMNSWMVTQRMCEAITSAAGADGVTGPNPLELFAQNKALPSNLDMFLGTVNGSLGEISALALLAGGIYLVARKAMDPVIPLCFLGSAAVMSLLMGQDPVFQICAGSLMLGAVFMASDPVTTPLTTRGKIIFGIGCGVLTMIIRMYSVHSDGTVFAILFMNILTPLIDKATGTRPAGAARKGGDA